MDRSDMHAELQAAREERAELAAEVVRMRDLLDVEALDLTEEGKLIAYETVRGLRKQVAGLETELETVKRSRDGYLDENARLKRTIAAMRKRA